MQKLILGNKDISTSLRMDGKYIDVAWPVYTESIDIEYLVIAGGGGGGSAHDASLFAGGGGGAGQIQTGSFTFATGSDNIFVMTGRGGEGANYPGNNPTSGGRGLPGYDSYISGVVSSLKGEGGHPIGDAVRFDETGGPSGAGFAGGSNDIFDQAAGGGAGNTGVGFDGDDGPTDNPAVAIGGNGGTGTTINDWYWNSSLDVVGAVAGGGGGSAYSAITESFGLGTDGGGNGALETNNASDATNFGGGGGGAFEATAGSGSYGLVVLRYENRFAINDSGTDVFQLGDYWYHSFSSASLSQQTFERPDKILIDV